MKEDNWEDAEDSAVWPEEEDFDGRRTQMGYGKIPVWVYTAKNGYAWQGLEEGEDRATAAALDKALAAAGRVAGAWGAVVRRPVASRRWAEWPRSRLCWVLFRFFPGEGRDQRGRNCNYTVAACIPAEEGRPKLDFGKLFSSPEMSEVRSEGLDNLWIDLDGDEDYLLRGPLLRSHREENVPEPSWDRTWDSPELLREDALRALSRWCQGNGVDAGDLKALARTGADGAGTLVVHATYAVYPQVAAVRAAEDEWRAARTEGGAAARQTLEKWNAALGALGELNRALGGLDGLTALTEDCKHALDEAEGAAMDAERSARLAAAAAASAEAATEAIGNGLARFRMGRDPERGKSDNRRKLDELGRAIAEGIRKYGPGPRWNSLERELDELRQRVAKVEGCLDTVFSFQRAALAGTGGASVALEREARAAIAQARDLGRWGNGTFAQDALAEMERMYRIGHAQSDGGTARGAPVTFAGEWNGGHGHREGPRRRWWTRWWWWTAIGAAVAAMVFVPWWMGRQKVLKDWDGKFSKACGQAKTFEYSQALATLETIQPRWLFCLGTNRYAAERETWNTLVGWQRELQSEAYQEREAREALIMLEKEKKALHEPQQSLAEEAWKDYQTERAKTEAKKAEIQVNDNGVPILNGVLVVNKKDIPNLLQSYADVTAGWKRAAEKLKTACTRIDAKQAAKDQADREAREAKAKKEADQAAKERKLEILKKVSGDLRNAQKEETAAKTKLELLEAAKAELKIGESYATVDWENYQYYRNLAAENGGEAIQFDEPDQLPYREVDGTRVYLDEKEIRQLPETIRAAARNWRQATTDFEKACKRYEAALREARQNLGMVFEKAIQIEKSLAKLQDDARYDAVRTNKRTLQAWNSYASFANKANQEMDGIPWFNDREPFPEPDKLGNDQLLDLYGKLRKVITYRENACTQLKKAYEIIKKEKTDAERETSEKEDVEQQPPPTPQSDIPVPQNTPAPNPVDGDTSDLAKQYNPRPAPKSISPSDPGAPPDPMSSSDDSLEGGEGADGAGGRGGDDDEPEEKPGLLGRTLQGIGAGFKTVGRGMNPVNWFSSDSNSDTGQDSAQDGDGNKQSRRGPIGGTKEENP